MEACKCAASSSEPYTDVLAACIVLAEETSQVRKFLDIIKGVAVHSDWCVWCLENMSWGITFQIDVGLFRIDFECVIEGGKVEVLQIAHAC